MKKVPVLVMLLTPIASGASIRVEPIHLVTRPDRLHTTFAQYHDADWVIAGPASPIALTDLPDDLVIADRIELPIERRIEFVTRPTLSSHRAVVAVANELIQQFAPWTAPGDPASARSVSRPSIGFDLVALSRIGCGLRRFRRSPLEGFRRPTQAAESLLGQAKGGASITTLHVPSGGDATPQRRPSPAGHRFLRSRSWGLRSGSRSGRDLPQQSSTPARPASSLQRRVVDRRRLAGRLHRRTRCRRAGAGRP